MSVIRRALNAPERRTAAEFGDSTPPPPSGGMAGSGPISERAALQIAAVYGSVGVIADALATLPWGLLSSLDPAKRRNLPLTDLLDRPYVEIYRYDWLVQYAMSMALRGNFYGQVVSRDENQYPTQIKPIHPDRARFRRLPTGETEYRLNGAVVRTEDVLHVRKLSLAGSLVGVNPIEELRLLFGGARAIQQYGNAYFDNSANPEGVIETEDDLDPDETLALARNWMAAHQGVPRAHLPAVLTGGAKFNPISINPQDSQFLETQQWTGSVIAGMVFRVPPHMVGIVDRSTSWGAGIEQQEMGFVRNTLSGYYAPLEEAMTRLHPREQYVRFNLSERLRGDKLQRAQAAALGTAGGWLCADDVRATEDMPPIPDGMGKNFMIPINSELLAQALQSIKDQSAATAAQAQQQGGGGADA